MKILYNIIILIGYLMLNEEKIIRTCGEIGIRDRFRFYCRKACRFDPCQVHQR